MDEQEKEIEEILRTFDKAPSPSSENITLADYDFTYEIKDNQLYRSEEHTRLNSSHTRPSRMPSSA